MQTAQLTRPQRFWIGFWAGLIAGIVASVLMILLSMLSAGVALPGVLADRVTALLSPAQFESLLSTFGSNAKHYLFFGIVVGQCLVFALSGGIFNLIVPLWAYADHTIHQLRPNAALLLASALWLLTGLVLLPVLGAGIFGAQLVIGVVNTMLSLAVVGLIFAFLFVLLQNWLTARRLQKLGDSYAGEEAVISRRNLLQGAGVLLGVVTLGGLAWRFISGSNNAGSVYQPPDAQPFQKKIDPPPVPRYGEVRQVPHLSTEITPNDRFYVVSKNVVSDPTVQSNGWRLVVQGHVEQPYILTYEQLTALPTRQQYESMMCISNEVGGEYMSNASWEGVPLKDLLQKAGVKQGAERVVLYAADDYSDSIPVDKALEETTLVALKMNGETLPQGHGFPARLLVPGIYGMKHVKWITRIEVVKQDYNGYWQMRGWSNSAPIRMTARIDAPLTGATVPATQTTYISGVAFSGNKGISQVDVSVDGGRKWQAATLKRPASNLTWVLWQLPWQPDQGTYDIVVRAVDSEGNVQSPQVAPPAPDGSSGYHRITISVI